MARFGNTTNRYTHIRNKHCSIYTDSAKERRESSNSTRGKDSSSQNFSYCSFIKKQEVQSKLERTQGANKINNHVFGKGHASSVDKPGFRAMISN